MNSSQNTPLSTLEQRKDGKEIDFLALLDIILDAKWLIASLTILSALFALAYAMFSTPIYQVNSMIQVEQNQSSHDPVMGELALLFDAGSPVSAEIDILRSRLVIGETVDRLQLQNWAYPNYVPIIGRWLASRATTLSEPGFFGYGNYVSGTERISLGLLEVPDALQGKELQLIATDTGYDLFTEENELILSGTVETTHEFEFHNEAGLIHINELDARPGASFTIVSTSRIGNINALQSQLNIEETDRQSGMLSVKLEGSDPHQIAQILNTLGQVYVQQNIDRKAAEADKSLVFLDAFLPELREQMQVAESEYTQFRDEQGTFDLGAEGLASLDTLVNLQLQLLELEQRRRQLSPQFTDAHPSIKALDQQIAAVNAEIDSLTDNVRKMPELEQQLLTLTRNVKVNSEIYVSLLNSAQQLRLVKEGKVGNVRVIDEAYVPSAPIKPRKSLILAAGLIIGFILGVFIAVVRNMMNPGIKEAYEIEQSLGMHVFATVPHSSQQTTQSQQIKKKAPGNHVLAKAAPQDPAVESLRSLRTALQFAMLEAPNNIVLISSPTPGTGKSFISVNFATVLAASDKKVLLIDADLRKGYLNQYFGKTRQRGLSEFISDSISAKEAIHREVIPNIDFMSTGVIPPNPAELLISARTIGKIKELAKEYDLVLIDTTPILAVSDAMALTPHAGAVFLLARANQTTLGELKESAKRIRQTGGHVKGIIFNGMIAKHRRYGAKDGYYHYANYNYDAKS